MATTTTATSPAQRIAGLDILRGAVMVLMAIDHVRVYSGVPAGGPTAGIFFTRWVTHFCAPIFVFLAGTAAFLHLRKVGDRGALARYLVVRGLMLVVFEMTIIRFSWTFNLDYRTFTLAGVIWMLGWCMVLLAGLIWLPVRLVGAIGLLLVAGQDYVGALADASGGGWLWQFLYTGGEVRLGDGGPVITVLYTVVPWIGIMALGYAFGEVVVLEPVARRRTLLRLGLSMTAVFLVVASARALSASDDDAAPFLIRVLNQRKYPASLLFALMTLGPSLALLPLAERAGAPIARWLGTFGRVPLFYYLLHIPVIHAIALLVWFLRDGVVNAQRFATAPYVSIPEGERWSLALLYLVFAVVVATLYLPCRWYAGFKAPRLRSGHARHPRSWTRYI